MAIVDLPTITREIEAQKATWVADDTPLLQLHEEDQRARLGVIVDEAQLQQTLAVANPDIATVIAHFEQTVGRTGDLPRGPGAVMMPPGLASVDPAAVAAIRPRIDALSQINKVWPWFFPVDWRNRKGRNNVTPITDQGGCGACVSFGCTAALESMVLVEHVVTTDLSEAELLFCGGGSCAGWWPDPAIAYIKSSGVSQESCFPYHDHNMPCHTCAERSGEAIKAISSVVISNVADRKHYLAAVGPMIGVFAVYGDFFAYHSGVYHHVTGGLAGYHCVEIIGYDDWAGAWICKNSWGAAWGDAGFFKMRYGDVDCGMDTRFPFWGIYGTRWL